MEEREMGILGCYILMQWLKLNLENPFIELTFNGSEMLEQKIGEILEDGEEAE